MAQIGRISGPVLTENLERQGKDLDFRNLQASTPIIKLKAGISIGSNTAPTVCNLPLGDNADKYEFQSRLTLVVFNMNFNFPETISNCFESFELITLLAPISSISASFEEFELKAITSHPQCFRNFIAKWPNPPIPITPTESVGFIFDKYIGLNTVIPPHNNGPVLLKSIPSGIGIAQDQ